MECNQTDRVINIKYSKQTLNTQNCKTVAHLEISSVVGGILLVLKVFNDRGQHSTFSVDNHHDAVSSAEVGLWGLQNTFDMGNFISMLLTRKFQGRR